MIRPKKDSAAHVREDAFLGDLVPQITEHLAERRSGDFDAVVGQARFEAWLAAHTKEPAVPAPRVRVPARRPAGTAWVKLGTGLTVSTAGITEGVLHPATAVGLAIAAVVIPLIAGLILLTAILRGSSATVDRVFRLLRWIANRPDPDASGSSSSQSPSATPDSSAGNDPIARQPATLHEFDVPPE